MISLDIFKNHLPKQENTIQPPRLKRFAPHRLYHCHTSLALHAPLETNQIVHELESCRTKVVLSKFYPTQTYHHIPLLLGLLLKTQKKITLPFGKVYIDQLENGAWLGKGSWEQTHRCKDLDRSTWNTPNKKRTIRHSRQLKLFPLVSIDFSQHFRRFPFHSNHVACNVRDACSSWSLVWQRNPQGMRLCLARFEYARHTVYTSYFLLYTVLVYYIRQ